VLHRPKKQQNLKWTYFLMKKRSSNSKIPMNAPAFLEALAGRMPGRMPLWLMRQAGRYLPEYREVRARAGSFLGLCYNPALAAEVTLQPIRRFGFDAAIVFSDILVVPHALGQRVEFLEGEGPKLAPVTNAADLSRLLAKSGGERLNVVYETVERIVAELGQATPLIGFCGAPWTVASYMVQGEGSPDQRAAKLMAYQDPQTFRALLDLLVEVSSTYLIGQIKAGASAVKIFDSWAGSLADSDFAAFAIEPTAEIVRRVKSAHPGIPVIGFPRGSSAYYEDYVTATGVDALACDTAAPLDLMARMQERLPVQGNLDPLLLLAGGDAMERRAKAILERLSHKPFVFNLGHGILPETPIKNVERLVSLIHSNK
jgi:uroporphyrinogen decarboxylase